MSVVVVGSANVDLTVRGSRLPRPGETVAATSYTETPGGKGLNQAVAASRAGADVSFFFAVGNDSGAQVLEGFLGGEELETKVAPTNQPTGRAFIETDDAGQNSIMVVGGANIALDEWPDASVEEAIAASYFLVLQQEISPTLNLRLAALANSLDTQVVLTPAPVENTSPSLLSFTDILVLNEHEASLLGGNEDPTLAARTLSAGKTLILTRGSAGA
jgi:ribokinase